MTAAIVIRICANLSRGRRRFPAGVAGFAIITSVNLITARASSPFFDFSA